MLTAQSNAIESWLYQVKISKSESKATSKRYRLNLERFCESIGKTAEAIIEDYERLPEKTFKREYATAIVSHLAKLGDANQSSGSVSTTLNSIRSFFKYHSLPLNFIPAVRVDIENHNRDIEANEIVEVLKDAEIRERAFFSLIAQAGLRPDTLTKLKIRNIEKILESETPVPCLITVEKGATKGKYHEYFTFASLESVTYLKKYFKTRQEPLTQDSYVFVMYNDESRPVSPGVFSHLFRRIVLKLKDQNILTFKERRKKIKVEDKDHRVLRNLVTRNELRLFNLRKFFRKYAGQAGPDFVNFWMGHTASLGVDLNYFSKDFEYHREIYKEKAMPYLRLESRTPTETEKEIEALRAKNEELYSEIENMKSDFEKLKEMMNLVSPALIELYRKNLAENPEQKEDLLKKAETLKSSLFKKKEQKKHKD